MTPVSEALIDLLIKLSTYYFAGVLIYMCAYGRAFDTSSDAWDNEIRFEMFTNSFLWPFVVFGRTPTATLMLVRTLSM